MTRASPARRVAFAVVRRTFEEGSYTDRALRAEAARAGLAGRELAFATRLAYGAVQRRATLDHVAARLAGRPVERLDPVVTVALRLGLLELCYLGGTAEHAAVDQAVELAKGGGSRGGGLVNAVLRRAVREGPALVAALPDDTPPAAALKHSHPEWVAEMWWDWLGSGEARALMAADNEPAESALRVNTLVADPAEVAEELDARPVPPVPEGLLLERAWDAHGSPQFEAGRVMPQSRASMMVARLLGPRPGERVLDLCAAPGGKATHLAALMQGEGEVVAVERDPARAQALEETRDRLHAGAVRVVVADARDDQGGGFDRVLVDPPCSGLGTLRSRPDLRWRASPEQAEELAGLQREILAAAAGQVRPGGTVVYSVCTLSPPEGEDVVAGLLASREDLVADDLHADLPLWKHPSVPRHLLTLPHRDGTDGFFVARLRRRA